MRTFEALGLFIGMIVGAGMFAMPYAVAQAGIPWSLFHFVLAAIIVTVVHLLYGKIILAHGARDEHRLPGYMQEYFGFTGYAVTFTARLFSYFGYLLAYGVLGGLFLRHFFPNQNLVFLSGIFFIGAGLLTALNLRRAGGVNFWLTVFLIFFILLLSGMLLPQFEVLPATVWQGSGDWFLPYGIFLFAFSGASVVPEVIDMIGRREQRRFRSITLVTTIIVGFLYALFIAAILGIGGEAVPQDALSILYGRLLVIGSLIGFLAIVTSYLTLGLELRFTFEYDFGSRPITAWLLVAMVPPALFFVGINDFVEIISIVGALGIGIEGISIALLARRVLSTRLAVVLGLSTLLLVGALLEIFGVIGFIA
ncbi:MAG: aromatic amino acid transport family protein [Patescibacteria group bacterium]